MKRFLMFLMFGMLLASSACADVYSNLHPGIVSVVANKPIQLRREPKSSAEVMLQIGSGVSLTLLSVDDQGWAYVLSHTPEGESMPGYIRSENLMNGNYLYWDMSRVVNPEKHQRLNLRSKPSAEAPSLGKYYTGVLVQNFHQEQNGYIRVCVGDMVGYMDKQYLMPMHEPAESAIPIAAIQSENALGANLYPFPSLSSERSALYPNGTEVAILGVTSEEWCHVMISGVTGFMQTKHLEPKPVYRYETEPNSNETTNTQWWNGPVGQHRIAEWNITVDDYTAVVNNPSPSERLHLRVGPSEQSASLGKYYNGVRVVVNGDCSGEWTPVVISDALHGYMKTEFLKTDGTDVPSAMPVMHISNSNAAKNLHLREQQSTVSRSLGIYPNGTEVILMGFSNEWAHVIVDGQFGFMLAKYLE